MNKTKIVATIGPASQDKGILRSLISAGLDVVRLNLSHADYAFCEDVIKKVNELNEEMSTNVAILLDTKGPDIRIDHFTNGSAFFRVGDKIRIYMKELVGDHTKFSISYPNLINDVEPGDTIKANDGKVKLEVIEKTSDCIICEVINEGYIFDHKSLNVPGVKLNRKFVSPKDEEDIAFACKVNADFLALSFVGTAEDVLDVSDLLIKHGNDHINLIAKIECQQALGELEEIIKASDGVMVARGDLGAEIQPEKIPGVQKLIISKAHTLGKVTIVATEMMSSMENCMVPTRAEVSDVANAVLDGTDAVMLSGETTIGKYPIDTVMMMDRIIASAEEDINYLDFLDKAMRTEKQDITGLISYSVAECAVRLKAKAIVVPTMTGYTARKMSRFRPVCPIIALSPNKDTIRSLALHFGVYGVHVDELTSFDNIMIMAKTYAKELVNLDKKDKIIITGGYPMQEVKNTNFMQIEEI